MASGRTKYGFVTSVDLQMVFFGNYIAEGVGFIKGCRMMEKTSVVEYCFQSFS